VYVFTFSFNNAVSSSDLIALNNQVISELERMRREAVVAKFEVLFQNLPGRTDEDQQ
jgi:hypothetical protein